MLEDNELFAKIVAADAQHGPRDEALEQLLRDLPPSAAVATTAGATRFASRKTRLAVVGTGLLVFAMAVPLWTYLGSTTPSGAPQAPVPVAQKTSAPTTPDPVMPAPATPSLPSMSIDDLPSVAADSSAAAKGGRNPATASSSKGTLRREVELIAAARRALSSGAPASCLTSLDAYDAEFPSGQFAVESSAMRAEAIALGGDRDRARVLAKAFLAKYPDSPYGARVRSLLSSLEAR
ncbi:hypothetical protein AKJ09_01523 [Labilithrix luteola]|uniref:Outer membrane lipoprotein BamD-like domain-containing protein n=1 Tax=Labilithrix luteola TaxID=1391654 RepID=A0A0K1PP16_9BACT|nr:hypothetical protein AKJ09_01523 [Labilithrix luteola]